ncbi:MAG: Rossmann-like and DUF2520 domain-containing protein [Candidatus Aminicenantales bacterium]
MNAVSIIGAGRLGTSLARAMARKGCPIGALCCRTPKSARESVRIAGAGKAFTDPGRAAAAGGILFLTVPDDDIPGLVRKLASSPIDWRGRIVFHCSGLLPARVLDPLGKKGASIGSFHPAQTFAGKEARPGLFKGIHFGLEGDTKALEIAMKFVRRLGGKVLLLSEEDKPLYHAACVLCSGGTSILAAAASSLLQGMGLDEREASDLLLPLLGMTMRNIEALGPERALTGPFVRGDVKTVRRHLENLPAKGGYREIYKALGMKSLETARKRGVPRARIRALKELLEDK